MVVRCKANSCMEACTMRVRLKRGDILSVCDRHAEILREAGEVVETLPTFAEADAARRQAQQMKVRTLLDSGSG